MSRFRNVQCEISDYEYLGWTVTLGMSSLKCKPK